MFANVELHLLFFDHSEAAEQDVNTILVCYHLIVLAKAANS